MAQITLNFDGSCEPQNPGGNMGFGIVIKMDGSIIHTDHQNEPAAPTNSNNVAEYRALLNGLQWLFDNGHADDDITVLGDSMLVIKQMSGEWRAKGGMYFSTFQKAKSLAGQFKIIKYSWIVRDENFEADQLSRNATPAVAE